MLTVLAAEGDDELLSGIEGHGDGGIGELTPAPLFEGKRGGRQEEEETMGLDGELTPCPP